MPRDINTALRDHFGATVTTLAMCIKVTRTDGNVFAYTDHDVPIEVSGVTYKPGLLGNETTFEQSGDGSVSNMEAQAYLTNDEISQQDLYNGEFDSAGVEVFIVNYEDISQGTLKLVKGEFGEVTIGDETAKVELRSLSQYLQQTIGRIYAYQCDAELGDSRCGVDLESSASPYQHEGEVTAVTNNKKFTDDSSDSELLAQDSGYFKYGKLVWDSGNNVGLSREIKTHDGATGTIELLLPMPYEVQVGDTFTAYAGCDKNKSTCINKFNNIVNFRGFPSIPGRDEIMRYPD